MKKDQYFPHEVSMRQTNEVIHLIDEQGMTGYGLYWCLMEYLRTQDNYIGDLRALRHLSRQMRTRPSKVLPIIHNYNLFVCNDDTFYSPKLLECMKPLEEKRKRIEAYKQKKKLDNLLEINTANDTVNNKEKDREEDKGEGKGEIRDKVSSSKEEKKDDDVVADGNDCILPAPFWECQIDSLQQEEQWKEIMAMRSGLGKVFYQRFDKILRLFKLHIQGLGKEREILSLNDAKRYFCFFITPGSSTYTRLLNELKKQDEDDPYRFEYRDEETGQRMYCGVVIPDDAPPRPNEQSVWNPAVGKWTY